MSTNKPNDHIIVCGYICSGKGTYVKSLPTYTQDNTQTLSVSSVVKELSEFSTRSELGTTADLDQQIADNLITVLTNNTTVIIEGIRQCTILTKIHEAFPDISMVWLDVPADILRERFDARKDLKDDVTFDQAFQIDKNLGIEDVKDYIQQHGNRITNY